MGAVAAVNTYVDGSYEDHAGDASLKGNEAPSPRAVAVSLLAAQATALAARMARKTLEVPNMCTRWICFIRSGREALLVLAEGGAHAVRDLAERGERLHGLEDRGEQVPLAASRRLDS